MVATVALAGGSGSFVATDQHMDGESADDGATTPDDGMADDETTTPDNETGDNETAPDDGIADDETAENETVDNETADNETGMAEPEMEPASPTQSAAFLRAFHASPDAPPVDIYVDNESAVTNLSFGNTTDYLLLESGTYRLTITAADDREAVVFDGNVSLDARTITTVAATGEVGENASVPFQPLTVEDDAFKPGGDYAAISVAHLSPDAPAVDVTVEGSDVVLADNVSYGGATDYLTVPEGDYTVEIRAATEDNNGTVVSTVDVDLDDETAYTAYAVGYVDPANASADTPFRVVATEDATLEVELPEQDE